MVASVVALFIVINLHFFNTFFFFQIGLPVRILMVQRIHCGRHRGCTFNMLNCTLNDSVPWISMNLSIQKIPEKQKFWRQKFSSAKNFVSKNFCHLIKISSLFADKVFKVVPIEKNLFPNFLLQGTFLY